jgi:hypothetical protein
MDGRWRTSSRSGDNGACVEVRRTDGGDAQMRDSKDRPGPVLTFTPTAWTAFLDGTGRGEFDLPS